jgi:hypothetical protein
MVFVKKEFINKQTNKQMKQVKMVENDTCDPEYDEPAGLIGVNILTLIAISRLNSKNDYKFVLEEFTDEQMNEYKCQIRLFPSGRARFKYVHDWVEGKWEQDKICDDITIKLETPTDKGQEEPTEQIQLHLDRQTQVKQILSDSFMYVPISSVSDKKISFKKWILISKDKKSNLVFEHKIV